MAPAPQGTSLLRLREGPGSAFRNCWRCSIWGWHLAGGSGPQERLEGILAHMGAQKPHMQA